MGISESKEWLETRFWTSLKNWCGRPVSTIKPHCLDQSKLPAAHRWIGSCHRSIEASILAQHIALVWTLAIDFVLSQMCIILEPMMRSICPNWFGIDCSLESCFFCQCTRHWFISTMVYDCKFWSLTVVAVVVVVAVMVFALMKPRKMMHIGWMATRLKAKTPLAREIHQLVPQEASHDLLSLCESGPSRKNCVGRGHWHHITSFVLNLIVAFKSLIIAIHYKH